MGARGPVREAALALPPPHPPSPPQPIAPKTKGQLVRILFGVNSKAQLGTVLQIDDDDVHVKQENDGADSFIPSHLLAVMDQGMT